MRSEPGFSKPGRAARAVAIGLTWLVTAVVVGWGTHAFRKQVRQQFIGRDAQILLALARSSKAPGAAEDALADDPFAVVVSMARLETILAARLYDGDGHFVASVPVAVREADVPPEVLGSLRRFEAFSQYRESLALTNVFLSTALLEMPSEATDIPALEVFIPLSRNPQGTLKAAASFLIEAESVQREFSQLDRRLLAQASLVLATAMTITGLALSWAFRRLERANRLLAHRTEDLSRANQELSQSARIATLGAVTAHLVHGLRNPVSGLQSFVAAGSASETTADDAWIEARAAATQRMQALIQQVVAVIREQAADLTYELSLREVAESVLLRARPGVEAKSLRLRLEGDPSHRLDNRAGGLLALLLSNLLDNAIDATPTGGVVRVRLAAREDGACCEVIDEGDGVPAAIQRRLFQPQQSTKEGGGGLGLAITRQLALALGGDVRLATTGSEGSTFRVDLPPGLPGYGGRRRAATIPAAHS